MRIGKRVYFDTEEEKQKLIELLEDDSDIINMSLKISQVYGKDMAEAMEIANIFNKFIRKEK